MTNVIELPKLQAKKAVIFARVSTRDQEDGYSPEAQIFRLKQYCERRQLEILKVFEITESSTKGDRKKFMEMIKFCKDQRQTIAIVADKIDRVQRSFKEYPLLNSLIEEGKIELHFNTENYVIHQHSVSQERLMWSFGVIMAQSYVDSLKDNVRRSIDHKIRAGEYPSRAPLGYLNLKEDRRSDIILDTFRAPLIERLFKEFSTGLFTLNHLRKEAISWGLRTREGNPVSRSQIFEILNNPFYYGIMVLKGKTYPHRYETLIDKPLFDACQGVLKGWNKKRFAYASKEFAFRGLLTCRNTGKTISSYTKTKTYINGSKGEWTYLQACNKAGKTVLVREDKVISQVEEALKNLVIDTDTVEQITKHLRDINQTEQSYLVRRTEELKKEDQRIQRLLNGLMELLIDKAISRDEYDARRAELYVSKNQIDKELLANREGDDSFKDTMLLILEIITKAPRIFAGSDASEKRKIMNLVFSNLSLDGPTLYYSYRKPFQYVVEGIEKGKWLYLLDSLRTSDIERKVISDFMHVYRDVIKCLLRPEHPLSNNFSSSDELT